MKTIILVSMLLSLCACELEYRGHDISSLLLLERQGITYKNVNGESQKLEQILKSGGANYVRSRIWVDPAQGVYGLEYNLELAKRVQAAGLGFYLDFHYSYTWADPGHQYAPHGWPDTSIADLSWKVYNYTLNVTKSFVAQGTPIGIASIGNEITNGLMWPLGKISSFANIAKLLHSASWGVKDGQKTSPAKIMIHLSSGDNLATQEWWYKNALASGDLKLSDFDIQGISFYPFYGVGATIEQLNKTTSGLVSLYNKDVVVAETNWPTSCTAPLSEKSIPVSVQGQTEWLHSLIAVMEKVPGGHGKGIFYWEPAWTTSPSLGSPCANNLLFDASGKALSSVNFFN